MRNDAPLPEGLLVSLAAAPTPSVLLLRHSDRYAIADGDPGLQTALTPEGERRAARLGETLGSPPTWAMSSPLFRCTRTVELLGALPTPSSVLGDPGPFVVEPQRGGQVWAREGNVRVVRRQLQGERWGCLRSLAEGVGRIDALLDRFLMTGRGRGVAVSHDAIVIPYVYHHTGHDFSDDWLPPLDGVVVTTDAVYWRGERFERGT